MVLSTPPSSCLEAMFLPPSDEGAAGVMVVVVMVVVVVVVVVGRGSVEAVTCSDNEGDEEDGDG